MPAFPVHHQPPEFIQTHVHRVGDATPGLSFLSLILRIDWLFLLFLKIEASRHNGDNK